MKVQNSNTGTRRLRDDRILELNDGEPVRFDAAGRTGDLDDDLVEYLTDEFPTISVVEGEDEDETDDTTETH